MVYTWSIKTNSLSFTSKLVIVKIVYVDRMLHIIYLALIHFIGSLISLQSSYKFNKLSQDPVGCNELKLRLQSRQRMMMKKAKMVVIGPFKKILNQSISTFYTYSLLMTPSSKLKWLLRAISTKVSWSHQMIRTPNSWEMLSMGC